MHIGRCLTISLSAVLLVGCSDERVTTAAVDAAARRSSEVSVACAQRANNTVEKLLECVTLDGVKAHLTALQAIADANGGTRVSGTAGFDLSKDYVVNALTAAGYAVTVQPFQFQTFIVNTPTLLEQVSPEPAGSIATAALSYSGSGDVTAAVIEVLDTGAQDGAGCNASDFAGFPAGNIALIRRGLCTFALKATNAHNAGASAVVIYNNSADGVVNGTLSNTFTLDIPVVGVTNAAGQQLAATPGLILRVRTDTFRGIATSYNVFAETRGGDASNVVMVGAHLDAVNAGAGIQDNGSGSAAVLETALQMARVRPLNTVRFAWWGAEESNLVGSTHYVTTLSETDLNRIALYLNFDMIGSPNYHFGVYDGDNSDGLGVTAHPEGSGAIEELFASYYESRALPFKGAYLIRSSDHTAFVAAGIPVGGVFTGAAQLKTAEEVGLWGGTAGIAYDPCYHQACDTYANVNSTALEVNADAVAFATLKLAMNTSAVNGGRGRGNFKANRVTVTSDGDAPHTVDR